ncbi:UNVERIFIED_CONTAM: subtilase family protein [Acetivibrio alkalicellulosi]
MCDNIKIAVIDDGVYESFFNIGCLENQIEITTKLEIVQQKELPLKFPNHGSICAAIIKKYAPNAFISSIKILNNKKRGVIDQLVRAIEWCVEKDIKIINLSLGTVYYKDSFELKKIVNTAAKKGVIIVCACSNQLIVTYPSCFSNVIGVKTDNNEVYNEQYIYNYYPNDGIDITAGSIFSLQKTDGEFYNTQQCNSYATPFITAKVYDIINKNPQSSIEKVKLELMEGALNNSDKTKWLHLYKSVDWVENALLFDFNNSTSQLLKENCIFRITEKIDFKGHCFCSASKEIEEYFDINESNLKKYDTIVINANNIVSNHYDCSSKKLIQSIINKDKNLIYLDDREINNEIEVINKKTKIWHPSVFNYLNAPVLMEIDIPLITINDFSGRYLLETMRKLHKLFLKDKYNPIAATDSSQGILYGMNYSPLISQSVLNEYDPAGLKVVCALYSPDVLIYGVNAFNKDIDYLSHKNNSFEIDIDILIADYLSDKVTEYLKLACKGSSKLILLMPFNMIDKNVQINKDIKVFDLFCDECVHQVYKYIVDLYKYS